MRKARFDFYQSFVNENSGNPRKLFEASKQLLNHQSDVPFPPHINRSVLANEMGNFFVQKICNIRSKFKECSIQDCENCESSEDPHICSSSFNCFEPLTQSEVYNIIMGMAKELCALDPIPTPLLVKSIDALLPVITEIINLSLQSGNFPPVWKEALLPILKKANLDLVYKNYRPVSNLSFISKVIEQAVFLQVDNYMKRNDLYPSLQSAYRRNHSTETALLKVTNYILHNMNSQQTVLLVLLDLSAAFDTVDFT